MNVLIVSQCSKKAREQSCQILDQFAERKGDNCWQTAMTQQGLDTLRRLLRKSARRNTSVACHWLKKNGQTELLWVVGNLRRFNAQGSVPTNRTSRDILRSKHESGWRSVESVAVLAAIAGLFHDFGKAGALFQKGLKGKSARRYQPFRHEWLSVRLFQALVGKQTDAQWLAQLGSLTPKDETALLAHLYKDTQTRTESPFTRMPPLAQVVAWLILSHHRLPQYLRQDAPPGFEKDNWLTEQLNTDWNACNHLSDGWSEADFREVWRFPKGTPLQSDTWREKARQLAKRAAHAVSIHEFGKMDQVFTLHMARMTLMLADHFYSSQPPRIAWQDTDYAVWANTESETGQLKQKLDEHNVGVAHHALFLGRALPKLCEYLPAITRHKGFRERAKLPRFHWQNRAWDVAEGLRERAQRQGFFGVNMASTGCGKTFANARIMYALANEDKGCRFTVALGLRTLTLQTGEALREKLNLGEDSLAVLIGSSAVRELHGEDVDSSSASAEDLFEGHQYVHYDGVINQGPLRQLMDRDPKLSKLINAPVLVSTIDHLMPATEGVRGGKQIAPMLRLLTSDLVLDEPDDFDIADQYALCRLVNWAGMLGSRVLLSSATLAPSLVLALYSAYLSGRKAFQQACGEPGQPLEVCCAWFDEDESCSAVFGAQQAFWEHHNQFARRRARRLAVKPTLREARLVPVEAVAGEAGILATTLRREIMNLHNSHQQRHQSGKTVSLGLVRMANINPLVATARALMAMPSPEGYCIHYCVYHSQHPLLFRSHIEKRLDAAFSRHNEELLWQQAEIKEALERNPAKHHVFVVLGTSVIEVGRDWDADWGIAEPSSMRSLIQFAGRIQRHRQQKPESANLLIFSKNFRALQNNREKAAYCRPGFENRAHMLNSHDLMDILRPEQYQFINAVPRILEPAEPYRGMRRYHNLSTLEHGRSHEELLGAITDKKLPPAASWWRKQVSWSAELQRLTPFRKSQPEEQLFLSMAEEDEKPIFRVPDDGEGGWKDAGNIDAVELHMAEGVCAWLESDYAAVMLDIAERRDMELTQVSRRYGEINLRVGQAGDDVWLYNPLLGVFRELYT
ncbi:type I-F CRISPR-associated helicase Cas3f [Cedecea davisae]|uniref:type I-F CRISPR-associated helicase Cas3f n=1 Tax=Cedecea davisae TaxID=158484 RepID=UPI001D0AD614|nr:type I-F CRISPR-associated helicase Cas3f [Cedecea davisae]